MSNVQASREQRRDTIIAAHRRAAWRTERRLLFGLHLRRLV
jgi:hypothetical protein